MGYPLTFSHSQVVLKIYRVELALTDPSVLELYVQVAKKLDMWTQVLLNESQRAPLIHMFIMFMRYYPAQPIP